MRRSSSFHPQRHPQWHPRRRGQVLLLLVLLMIIAALLGSTFLLIICLNSRGASQRQTRTAMRAHRLPMQI